jgi:hypothetical protein
MIIIETRCHTQRGFQTSVQQGDYFPSKETKDMESPKALEKERPIITQDVKVQREEANVT